MYFAQAQNTYGTYWRTPAGVILHGTRSNIDRNLEHEFRGLREYGKTTIYSYQVTVGEDQIAIHLAPDVIGAHAAEANGSFLGAEFCQPLRYTPVTDAQVRAFVYWFANYARVRWPGIPAVFPTHAESDGWDWTTNYGKDDPFPRGDARAEELRQRIYREMDRWRIWR